MFRIAEELIQTGRYSEALTHLKELSAQSLGVADDLRCRMLIGKCTDLLGEYDKGLQIAQQVINDCEPLSESYWTNIDAMIEKSSSMLGLGQYDESLEVLEQTKELLYPSEILPREAELLRIIGWIKVRQGKMDEAFEFAQKEMEIGEKLGDLDIIASSCLLIGAIYVTNRDFDRALEIQKRGLKLRERQGNLFGASTFYNNIGVLFKMLGELDKALEHFEKSARINKEIGKDIGLLANLGNMGGIYLFKGELDKALEYQQNALAIAKKINAADAICNSFWGLGLIYREMGKFDRASDHLNQGLEMSKELGMELDEFTITFQLIITEIERGSIDSANQYLTQLRDVEKRMDVPWAEGLLKLADALVLKTRGRPRDRARAEELLCTVAYQENIDSKYRNRALLNLCGLLLEKLKASGDPELLKEIREHLSILSGIARDQNSFWVLAESYVLESKLALLEPDMGEARRLLTQAQRIADEKGLGRLAIKISSEHDLLLDEESKWKELEQKESALSERIELAGIDEQVSEMFRKGLVSESDLPDEEPIMVMLLSEGGLCLHSKSFTPVTDVSEDMIAGFLNAIQTFSDEIFSQALDRIRLESYTLLLRLEGPFTYCYVFKGQSYSALQKLTKFIESAPQKPSVWVPLLEVTKTGRTLSSDAQASLDGLLEEIFVTA